MLGNERLQFDVAVKKVSHLSSKVFWSSQKELRSNYGILQSSVGEGLLFDLIGEIDLVENDLGSCFLDLSLKYIQVDHVGEESTVGIRNDLEVLPQLLVLSHLWSPKQVAGGIHSSVVDSTTGIRLGGERGFCSHWSLKDLQDIALINVPGHSMQPSRLRDLELCEAQYLSPLFGEEDVEFSDEESIVDGPNLLLCFSAQFHLESLELIGIHSEDCIPVDSEEVVSCDTLGRVGREEPDCSDHIEEFLLL